MIDKIALEKHFQYDNKTNSFLGACREHGEKKNLVFETEDDLKMLFEWVDKAEVHHMTEVTHLTVSHFHNLIFGYRQLLLLWASFQIIREFIVPVLSLSLEPAGQTMLINMPNLLTSWSKLQTRNSSLII
jgi:hypothetical protein